MGRLGELSRKTPMQMQPYTPPGSVAKKAEHNATAAQSVVVAVPALSTPEKATVTANQLVPAAAASAQPANALALLPLIPVSAGAAAAAATADPSTPATAADSNSVPEPATSESTVPERVAADEVVIEMLPAMDLTWDLSGAPKVPTLELVTLNLGGRNANSFEFTLAGDDSELGSRWQDLYERAQHALTQRGPNDFPGLAVALKNAVKVTTGSSQTSLPKVVASLLESPTWEAMLAEAKVKCPRVIQALNRPTLATGRPSPLEQPSNLFNEAHSAAAATGNFLLMWLEWLRDRLPGQRSLWEARLATKELPPLETCVPAMLLFDAMCYVAVEAMHEPMPFPQAFLAHTALHNQLAFTSFEGKYRRLAAVLQEESFPAIVCLQEAGPLVGPGSKELIKNYTFFVAKQETALLLRKGILKGKPLPDAAWRTALQEQGEAQPTSMLRTDWASCLSKTVVVCTRYAGQPILAVASHCKASAATLIYLQALRQVLDDAVTGSAASKAFPGVQEASDAIVLMGIDSNCKAGTQVAFGEKLAKMGLTHTADPTSMCTVRKQRTRFQSQLNKLELDASHKDWATMSIIGEREERARLGPTRYKPALTDTMLLPTSAWPFDHTMVIARVHLPPPPLQLDHVEHTSEGSLSTGGTSPSTTPSFKPARLMGASVPDTKIVLTKLRTTR